VDQFFSSAGAKYFAFPIGSRFALSTGSGSDRVASYETNRDRNIETRSLALPVL